MTHGPGHGLRSRPVARCGPTPRGPQRAGPVRPERATGGPGRPVGHLYYRHPGSSWPGRTERATGGPGRPVGHLYYRHPGSSVPQLPLGRERRGQWSTMLGRLGAPLPTQRSMRPRHQGSCYAKQMPPSETPTPSPPFRRVCLGGVGPEQDQPSHVARRRRGLALARP
jgi:hypothetical protein